MSEPAIDIRDVAKSFGRLNVYSHLNLSVRRGETLTVLGPSGSGKSVLLKLLIGLLKPEAGTIVVEGVNLVTLSERQLRTARRNIGMLFQGSALFDSLSVGENVAYGLREFFDWPEQKIAQRVGECLEWVALPGIEDQSPSQLSGGMKKRVGLARALAPAPNVMLYDEPTTGLDPANARRITELIVKLQERLSITSVVITHDIAAAFAVSDRVALLRDRRIDLVIDAERAKTARPPELEQFIQGEA